MSHPYSRYGPADRDRQGAAASQRAPRSDSAHTSGSGAAPTYRSQHSHAPPAPPMPNSHQQRAPYGDPFNDPSTTYSNQGPPHSTDGASLRHYRLNDSSPTLSSTPYLSAATASANSSPNLNTSFHPIGYDSRNTSNVDLSDPYYYRHQNASMEGAASAFGGGFHQGGQPHYEVDMDDDKRPLREDQAEYGGMLPVDYNASAFHASHLNGSGLQRRETSAEAWARRQRQPLKRAVTKRVKLTQGNFIVECPVPTAVKSANLSSGAKGGPTEFSHMRYTAACCDPDDFTQTNGYTLRTSTYRRQTDLLVCITAYNENKMLLSRTLHGLMLNIRDIVKGNFSEFRKRAESGGPEVGQRKGEAWKRIVVCLVFDGIDPADKGSLDVLATIGLYQDGVMKKDVDGRETVAHIFEYTTQLSMSSKPALVEPHPNDPNNLVPVQMILCLKQKNAKKINSHRWLFNAIGRQLKPDVVCLLDAGTKPGARSIYYLWEAFHHNPNLGGACGEIHAMLGNHGRKLLNPLVAAQNFEYKMSNVLDKPMESAFGYVSVLPGAFSCYRYLAIQGRPLDQYFHGDQTLAAGLGAKGTDGMSIWTKNMFLAEDRILCFELVAKANERWVLGYVKPAKGETDVPETAAELIGQRRRWLNGSFAAGFYALVHFGRLYQSDHSILRLFWLTVQGVYNMIQLFLGWFALGNYYLTFSIIIELVANSLRYPKSIADGDPATIKCWSGTFIEDDAGASFDWLSLVNYVFKVVYLGVIGLQILLALGNRPKAERFAYTLCISIFAFFSLYLISNTVLLTYMSFCPIGTILAQRTGSIVSVFLGGTYGPIFSGLLGTFGVYIFSSLLYLDPWHLLTSMPQYLLIAPSFINILTIYAFCNLHDVSWGTKGSDASAALPSVTSTSTDKDKDRVIEVQEKPQEDIDSNFKATVLRAIAKHDEVEEWALPTMEDRNKTFRTRFVAFWLLCNALLCVVISRLNSVVQARYFQVILWSVFVTAVVRLSGMIYYLFGEFGFRIARLCARGRR
ncbi:BQ5605_C016g08233 [Microbotryum silenes-dioicae]|uniref:chitin synthase n=1 Tax=Microbotryum silenes-dioicae TaxID=796604 RepID=A0A2X0LZL4_9BASI|nr:BQ5605_C016g08233 [Microbotryum silenes-dioicae]